mmetsp:Transcript_44778/g.106297  ORF Transcript_44778/g.106297 Transcript_44778/m.106297 type:complete len:174 (+) Transcript_44778:160-681(+)|eukprot:CAMPEP_0178379486 /NCGR_PEP_ID=MMETSP0689_2-20121128/4967_1 /TAXON_ID=160604 /ORGANISM="Amphidinium massartii, Strain CS-259" /LENGTH=173 /DNA_ID=CAMNT_0019999589 /DNA_START=67 /DNA_END=588 /DNA_ORIENTATION=+
MFNIAACCCADGVNETPEGTGRMVESYNAAGGEPDEPVSSAAAAKDAPADEAEPPEEKPAPEEEARGSDATADAADDVFLVALQLTGEKIGVEIAHGKGKDEGLVRVKSVKPQGLVKDWNDAHPDLRIEASHYILEMNGRKVTTMQLDEVKNAFTQGEQLTLLMKRTKPARSK